MAEIRSNNEGERERERSLWREFSENIFHKLNEYNNHKLFI